MQRISLSEREELIESLDAEAIYDYLIQHGVLHQVEKEKIENGKNKAQRNTALLQLVEGTGSSAVALFINALRQSGQLSLASSLDENSRIKPIYGSGNCCLQFDFAFLFNWSLKIELYGKLVPWNDLLFWWLSLCRFYR